MKRSGTVAKRARKRPAKASELVDTVRKQKLRGGVGDGRNIEYLERLERAIDLRKIGLTYQQIGEQIGYTAEGARQLILSAMKERSQRVLESLDEERQIEFERLEAAIMRLQPAIARGDTKAINTMVNLMKRKAALLGLDRIPKNANRLEEEGDNIINGIVEVYVPDNARGS